MSSLEEFYYEIKFYFYSYYFPNENILKEYKQELEPQLNLKTETH